MDAQSDANAPLAAVNWQPASLAAGNLVMTVSEGKEVDEPWVPGEVQVWCRRCGGAVQDAGMLWVPAINSSARGEAPGSHLRNCQVSVLPQLRTWQGEPIGRRKILVKGTPLLWDCVKRITSILSLLSKPKVFNVNILNISY